MDKTIAIIDSSYEKVRQSIEEQKKTPINRGNFHIGAADGTRTHE